MKRLAIIGASYLQVPLIVRAKEMGLETHVFAWEKDADGKSIADYFYPISIIEKEIILKKCINLQICGICSIASDLASITVNYVANQMGLVGNSMECVRKSTNKYAMRKAFFHAKLPSPELILVKEGDILSDSSFDFPVIVKPTDRSGSRGITKVYQKDALLVAVKRALEESFERKALIEEFAEGEEYSVEYLSYHGKHTFLTVTKKYTTGEPNFIETGHLEPADLEEDLIDKIRKITEDGLDALGVENGASHTELKVDANRDVKLIEIGARMGGDLIGSDLVYYSTGFDFVEAVIKIALGEEPAVYTKKNKDAAVRYIFNESDEQQLEQIKKDSPDILMKYQLFDGNKEAIRDSSSRRGYFVIASRNSAIIRKYIDS